jgi:hypothetical protein
MMNKGQGVLYLHKLLSKLVRWLLPITFICLQSTLANATSEKVNSDNIILIYSPDSTFQSTIAQSLTTQINRSFENIRITQIAPSDISNNNELNTGLVIAIGLDSINHADINFKRNDRLLISSDPDEYHVSKNIGIEQAVLYMSHSYCKKIRLIKSINKQWSTFSYLDNKIKPVNSKKMTHCANQYGLTAIRVSTTQDGNLSQDIKEALESSDLILALPNKTIYNSKSVKNILLTSYRNRKPVIGFSNNFVKAGALASIHSSPEQITSSAHNLIKQYYENNKHFKNITNYPVSFDISINKQVFRALNLTIPDIEILKKSLTSKSNALPGEPK